MARRPWLNTPPREKNGWIMPAYLVQVTSTPASPHFLQRVEHSLRVRGPPLHRGEQLQEWSRKAVPRQRQQGRGVQAQLQRKDNGEPARPVEVPAPVILD